MGIRREGGDGRPLFYHRDWRFLEIDVEAYDLLRVFSSLSEARDVADAPGDAELRAKASTGYASMTPEEKASFEQIQVREVAKSNVPDARRLVGWGRIVGDRSVRVFSAARDGKPQTDYDRTFDRVRVGLRSIGQEDYVGVLMHWDRDMPRGDGPFESADDHLVLDVVVRSSLLEGLAAELAGRTTPPALRLHLMALLYQDEVEEALARPEHDQTYAMLEGGSARVYVSNLTVGISSRRAEAVREEESEWVEAPAPVATVAPDGGDIGRRIRGLAIAVWGLAAAVVIAAVLR